MPAKHHARADQRGLRLQRDLRSAEREDARQRPAGEGQHSLGGAGGQDERVEAQAVGAAVVQQVQRAALDLPHQRVGAVVDAALQRGEAVEEGLRLAGLEPVQRRRRALARRTGG